jgi:hypothetical protein
MRNTHPEQMFSALHPKADSSQASRHDRFVPFSEVTRLPASTSGPSLDTGVKPQPETFEVEVHAELT